MSTRMKVAFGCYFIAGLILVGFGVTYMVRAEFMPYHAAIVRADWSDVPPNVKVLILALMKAVGGAYLALTVALYSILFLPFRQGAIWAIWTLPLLGLLQAAGGLYAMGYVIMNTAVIPPIAGPIAGALISLLAFGLSYSGEQHR